MNALAKTKELIFSDEGATAVEYGVIIALIIAAVVVIIATLGNQIEAGFTTVSDTLTDNGVAAGDG